MLYALLALEILVLLIIVFSWLQICFFLHKKDIPEDEPLGEAKAKYLTKHLNIIGICAVLEAVMLIATSILNFISSVN